MQSFLILRNKDFLLSFKKGKPNWALYDFEKIQNFPSIAWKLKNTKTMSSSKHKNAHENLEEL